MASAKRSTGIDGITDGASSLSILEPVGVASASTSVGVQNSISAASESTSITRNSSPWESASASSASGWADGTMTIAIEQRSSSLVASRTDSIVVQSEWNGATATTVGISGSLSTRLRALASSTSTKTLGWVTWWVTTVSTVSDTHGLDELSLDGIEVGEAGHKGYKLSGGGASNQL